LIIAHRLTSIKGANNLLFIEGRDLISSYRRGTVEYDEALSRLKNFTFAYGDGEEEEVEQEKMSERAKSIHDSVMMNSVLMKSI